MDIHIPMWLVWTAVVFTAPLWLPYVVFGLLALASAILPTPTGPNPRTPPET